jgi:hypothetical protein
LTQLECDVRRGGEEKADVLPRIIHLSRVICAARYLAGRWPLGGRMLSSAPAGVSVY